MTVPNSVANSVAISSLSSNNNNNNNNNNLVNTNQLTATSSASNLQLPNSCVSLVSNNSSTNGNQSLSIPISIRTTLASTNTQPQNTTMSWTSLAASGTPIQFTTAANTQRSNGNTMVSFLPQQTVYQMPNDNSIQLPTQTMLITQPPSRSPDHQTTNVLNNQQQQQQTNQQTTAGSIVQIIQTQNGQTQLLTSSNPSTTSNLTVKNTSNLITSSTSVNNNKQILPKGSKQTNRGNSAKSKNKNNNNSNNNNNNNNNSNNQLITTQNLPNNLNSTLNTMGQPQLMLNNSGFFTSNGNLFFNQGLPLQTTMGQQQFIINSNQNQQQQNKTQQQTNQPQTIIIPANNNQLKNQNLLQPVIQSQQQTAPQLIQLSNGQMILVHPSPQTSTNDLNLGNFNSQQNFNSQLQLIQQPTANNNLTDPNQAMSYSTGGNFIFTSQPSSFVNSNLMTTGNNNSISNNNLIGNNNNNKTNTNTTTTSTAKSKPARRKPPAKKDNKNSNANLNKVETTTTTSSSNAQKIKGSLNLADLLKEAGIMDSSPPSSPTTQLNQTTIIPNTTDLINNTIDQSSLNTSTSSITPQLPTLDLNTSIDQATNLLNNSNNSVNNNQLINQPTVVMLPNNQTAALQPTPGTNFFFNPLAAAAANTTNTSTTPTVNSQTAPTLNQQTTQPQFKLALASDGYSVILQPLQANAFAHPLPATNNNQIVQSNLNTSSSLSSKFIDSKDSLNNLNSGSSQPSPDSTTPTLDVNTVNVNNNTLSISSIAAAVTTSPTISFTNTTTSTTSTTNSQLGSIKLTDSISLTVQPQINNGDQFNKTSTFNKSQTTITPITTTPTNKKNSKGKKGTTTASNNKKQPASKANNNNQQQQLITIPIQTTNLNSSMNSTVLISDNSNLIKKNENIYVLNSTAGNLQGNSLQTTTTTTTAGTNQQQQPPVMQISLNNQEFIDRLEVQIRNLTDKKRTQEEEALFDELKSLREKMLQSKNNENGIILTSQPLITQQQQQQQQQQTPTQQTNTSDLIGSNKVQNQTTMITSINNNKLNKDNNNSQQPSPQIITTLSSSGKKLDQNNFNSINNLNKQVIQSQPTTIFLQTSPTTTSTVGSTSFNHQHQHQQHHQIQDPAATTNTFEGQKIKILTTTTQANNQTTNVTPQSAFQLGSQFFIATPNKGSLNTDGSSTQTLYQVVHLQQTPTNLDNSTKLIKLDQMVPGNLSTNQSPLLPSSTIITTAKQESQPQLDKKPKLNKFSFQQQLNADVSAASKPDCKTPFKNCNDACKRLLRYHVFYQPDLEEEKINKFDNDFEKLAQYVLYKKELLYRRFQYNILKLSMKTHSLSENIMLDKVFIDQEKSSLKDDKELIEKGTKIELPEPSFELKEKIRKLVDEELLNERHVKEEEEEERNKKRKIEELLDDSISATSNPIQSSSTSSVITNELKKKSITTTTTTNTTTTSITTVTGETNESENEESEGNEEESNDIHEFDKFLDNLNEDINLSPLYNNSNSYTSIQQDNSDTFNQLLFNQESPVVTTTQIININKSSVASSSSNWGVAQEDAVAVESILDGDVVADEFIEMNGEHHHHQLDSDIIYDSQQQITNVQKNGQIERINMNSDSDTQMESAINSILDIINDGNEQTSTTNGFNFNNLTSSNQSISQLSFSHNSSYSMNMTSNQSRSNLINDYGNDSVLDEAIKSISSL